MEKCVPCLFVLKNTQKWMDGCFLLPQKLLIFTISADKPNGWDMKCSEIGSLK